MPPPVAGLYVDPEFPACVSSLVGRGNTPLSPLSDRITWLRPQEISPSPHLFPENSRDALGKQGILGDCWFICACSALLKSQPLLHQVFPADQHTWEHQGYTGRFTCRFWRFGRWVEVTIDDRLPCLGHKLCFSHCQDQEAFWLPLLEKAYAKLHGCYEALWAGQVADALVDLTGGMVERWSFEFAEESFREQMLSKMLDLKERCAMSCSVLRSIEGSGDPGQFHAFTITDIQHGKMKSGQSLLLFRVHNPWGRNCWEGSWQKSGTKWALMDHTESSRFLSQIQDGEFWVEKEEFFQEFNEVTLSFPVIEKDHIQSIWTGSLLSHTQQIYGSWVIGQNAGGSRNNTSFSDNPKFWLRVREPSEMYVTLMQRPKVGLGAPDNIHNSRKLQHEISNNVTPIAVGLHIWKVEKRRLNIQKIIQTPPVAGTSSHSYDRQLHLRCELLPGYHLIIPSTFLRDTEGDFLLRVLTNGPISLSEITSNKPVERASEDVIPGIWETLELKGQWKKNNSAGGSRNFPSYHLNPAIPFCVPTNSQLVKVTLRQHNQQTLCHAIGFHVYLAPADGSLCLLSQEPCASCIPHSYSLEVSKTCILASGQYIVVPSTYLPDQECKFSIFISTKTERKPIKSEETLGKILKEVSVISLMK
ncbi:calpain-10 [Hyla sarda]|uniref:calpain-10 n=1 Tax=Hyla sarda TaxID=327740 RepID=UPI0024C2F163|nr:calpain-10 [Hyla sarda]XP_056421563.1 calpain-10 [Hyla sarda]XP_056421564.1 calpain-10 [Hyla sarda]XP_056421565.1 calpain-10 [Hyla sarda]XP_056421567.1 calpain-10 [Hyla sarda]XP_056421568.1 calpain-10 [Hyla sarda]